MIQMIATDMDGTLMNERGEIDRERLSAILDQLDQRGIPFVIATGNGYSRMAHVLGELKDRVTLVLANGARILEKGELIRECSWPEEMVQEVLLHLEGREQDLHLVVSSLSGGYAKKGTEFPLLEQLMTPELAAAFYKRMQFVDDLVQEHGERVLKLSVVTEAESVASFVQEIRDEFGGRLLPAASGYGAIDILQPEVNKATAIQFLEERWGVDGGHLMAFGDSQNDVEMLELAIYSYAMENADEHARKVARYTAPSHQEGGVYEIIEAYLEGKLDLG
jgi:cof-like hydrolase